MKTTLAGLALVVAILGFVAIVNYSVHDAQHGVKAEPTPLILCKSPAYVNRPIPCGKFTNDAIQGHPTGFVEHETTPGHYEAIPYTTDMCLLPSVDENYTEGPATICVNTGKLATEDQVLDGIFADACEPSGYVTCATENWNP